MPFPSDRLVRAGATAQQLDELQAQYDGLSPDGQASYDARIAPLSDYRIAELLSTPNKPEVVEEQQVLEAPKAPSNASASSTPDESDD